MIFKLIIFGAILYGLYRLFGGEIKLPWDKNRDGSKTTSIDGDTLVECATCGVYVTKKEAFEYKGKFYCSKECLPN